jgi:alpha-L-fucosidase
MRLYADFGKEIRRRFGQPLGEAKGHGDRIELKLPRAERFDHVVVQEDIVQGERVREYVIEALATGGEWRQVAAGQSIGHKWIHRISPVEAPRVRLRVTKSIAPPHIRSLAVFQTAA